MKFLNGQGYLNKTVLSNKIKQKKGDKNFQFKHLYTK